jgi:hypothetical protein
LTNANLWIDMKTDANAPLDGPQIDVAMRLASALTVSAMPRPANVGAISGEAAKRFREQKVAIDVGGEARQIK